jgi:hypothetical protein
MVGPEPELELPAPLELPVALELPALVLPAPPGGAWQTSSLPQTRPAGQPWAWQSGMAGMQPAEASAEASHAANARRLTT